MEDRHTVSEPRPIEDESHFPSWEVDILRDGTVIVDTFLLNNDVLPPRTNKRGKVLWRLPDSLNKLVSYIVDKDIRLRFYMLPLPDSFLTASLQTNILSIIMMMV